MSSSAGFAAAEAPAERGYLFSGVIDFLCLGGGSLPLLALLVLLPPEAYAPYVLAATLLLANFINHPHFIHSYQIFYGGFAGKTAPGAPLRAKYLIAGIVVPLAMVAYFLWCIVTADAVMLGRAANALFFLVGWHYAKQGYGILIVESVLKRAFFTDTEKNLLRYNALLVWLTSWMLLNRELATREIYGVEYVTFGIPRAMLAVVLAAAALSTCIVAYRLIRRARASRLPVNGLLAYLTSTYVWLLVAPFNILVGIIVPVFHSLQYLAVVWRYEINKTEASERGPARLAGLIETTAARAAMVRFVLYGTILGFVLFLGIPFVLDTAISYREEVFGATMFLFTFTVFINVHHYFLDNVMWRKENADVKEHLFG